MALKKGAKREMTQELKTNYLAVILKKNPTPKALLGEFLYL